MLKKIKRAFGFGSCDPMEGSTIIINAEKLERRVALLENGVLEEYTIEREGEDNIVGGIFKGRVKNIEPGLKAMFVDIGQEKNAFLHVRHAADNLYPAAGLERAVVDLYLLLYSLHNQVYEMIVTSL